MEMSKTQSQPENSSVRGRLHEAKYESKSGFEFAKKSMKIFSQLCKTYQLGQKKILKLI